MSKYGDLTAEILQRVKDKNGFKVQPLLDYDVRAVGRRVAAMCDYNKTIHRAKISFKDVRFFDTAARARAYEQACAHITASRESRKQRERREAMDAMVRANERSAAFKASNKSGYELTKEDQTKIKRVETPPTLENRFWVDPDQMQGFFSRLKPGKYPLPANTCAAKAA